MTSTKSNYLENNYCEYWIENNVVYEIFKSDLSVINLEIAKIIVRDRIKICDGVALPLYVELGEAVNLNREANKYLSTGEAMRYLTATGILVRDEFERLGASIYMKVFPPKVPTKFFTKKEKAIAWLSGYKTYNFN